MLVALLVLWGAPSLAADSSPLVIIRTFQEPDGTYRSLGELSLPLPSKVVEARMTDLASYGEWVSRGQDGNDPLSAKYIGQVTGVRVAENGLDFEYRLNLLWPFGGSGKVVAMALQSQQTALGTIRRLVLNLKQPSLVVPVLESEFTLRAKGPQESLVTLDCRMKFAWFLAPFFPLNAYRTEMVERFETALRSFAWSVENRRVALE